jgi:beta-galactosidase GanA
MAGIEVSDLSPLQVYYLGTVVDGAALEALVDHLVEQAGLSAGPASPEGVFIHRRRSDTTDLLFVLNENEEARTVQLPEGWRDAFTQQASQTLELGPVDVRLVVKDRKNE